MLQPVRTKFRKAFKGRIHGNATRAVKLNYGQFGLKATEPDRVIGKQIEAARVALTRYMKRTGKVTITDPAIKYCRGVSASPLRY